MPISRTVARLLNEYHLNDLAEAPDSDVFPREHK
jgi:hypothetical protein